MEDGGQGHAPAALSPEMNRYPLYSRLGGPKGRSGGCRKSRTRSVEPVASRYADWVIPARIQNVYFSKYRRPRYRKQKYPSGMVTIEHYFQIIHVSEKVKTSSLNASINDLDSEVNKEVPILRSSHFWDITRCRWSRNFGK